jgi:hypothetical protein
MQLVFIKARRNEKDGKMFLLDISRRVFIYSLDRVLCSFTSEREFSTYNSPKLSMIHIILPTKSHEFFFSFLFEKFNTGL